MTAFSDAVSTLKETDQDIWLGSLVMYSVCETIIHHDILVKILCDVGLDSHVPRVPEDSDIFRRVSTAAARKRVPTPDPDIFENYMIREVPSKKGVMKKIVREKVDTNGKKLAYEADLCDLQYDKTSGKITVDCPIPDANVISIAEQISNAYATERGCLNAMALRELIRRVLDSVNATNVRGKGGGAYFVSKVHLNKVISLEAFANALPDTVNVIVVPFLDDHKRREYVREAYEQECTTEIKDLLDDLTVANETGKKVTGDKFSALLTRYHTFGPQIEEYEGLLETQLGSVRSLLKIVQTSLMQLSTFSSD